MQPTASLPKPDSATHAPPSPSGGYSPSVTPQLGTGLPWVGLPTAHRTGRRRWRRAQRRPDRAARAGRCNLSAMCPEPRSAITATHPALHPCGGASGTELLSGHDKTCLVYGHHHAQLAELLSHIGAAVDRYRTGETGAYAVDETIHHYHRAAAALWKFCFARSGGTHAEFIAGLLDRMTSGAEANDWWERATPRR